MKDVIDELFEPVILKLIEDNYISMKNYFWNRTEMEVNSNGYSFVWKKSMLRFEKKLKEKF
ncbi:hypothetical protein [Sporosarcina obsidiansis]|uniref:hypothetical protein n=1 Tax=Sporosarcina obsidiansis TaxID=2660748 RepID=UPI00129B8CAA|nr:hypothetical protein [Sporosarcina obsidiansis]